MADFRRTPFIDGKSSEKIRSQFLNPSLLKDAFLTFSDQELSGLVRTYVEEGIPHFFRDEPLLWESIRTFISGRLQLSPSNIGIVGSGRLGFSPSIEKFGAPFSDKSDLDLVLVDQRLFESCRKDALRFISDVAEGKTISNNERQRGFWIESINDTLPRGLRNSYIQPKMIPSIDDKYPKCAQLNNEASIVFERLRSAHNKVLGSVSFRVYENWEAFAKRLKVNYLALAQKHRAN